jgi:drug/metabolite transporter (DMT)-like permease
LAAAVLGERLSLAIGVGVVFIVAGVFFVSRSEAGPGHKAGAPPITAASMLATFCYGLVPVMKKFGTDQGAAPVLGALVMHATGLAFLVTLGNLLKIESKWQRVPRQSLACFVAAGLLYAGGSIFTLKALVHAPASVVAPIWSAQPIVGFFAAKAALQGIEQVTFKDGIAAGLVVAGVLVLRMA